MVDLRWDTLGLLGDRSVINPCQDPGGPEAQGDGSAFDDCLKVCCLECIAASLRRIGSRATAR